MTEEATPQVAAPPQFVATFEGEHSTLFSVAWSKLEPAQLLLIRDWLDTMAVKMAEAQWMQAFQAQNAQRPNLTLARGPMMPPPHQNGRRN